MLVGLCAFLLAFVVGTLVEYWVHRWMHWLPFIKHAEHHRDGWGQGWFGEFLDYALPSLVIRWVGFLHSLEAGVGFLVGGVCYAAVAAYAHQIQHEKPDLCFWMRRPVHYLHHHHHMWKHNFGISLSFWDHVFRTYKKVEWKREKRIRDYGLKGFFKIKWF